MVSPLGQSIIALCDRYNLASAEVTYMRADHGQWFHGSVQWLDDSTETGRAIATANADSFAAALNAAVAAMLAKRGGDVELPTAALELAA